ncbi:DUF3997 domain-containing protein (plasmid) [Bacillus carboniphilus]|uniref:DUF3997 domain-containing protein n=1 Tax=Bacillus carboniphilus TaxID=86663 RepID=A0ABY9JYJ3_9BACI|nr:DUF3997 domain-containing protein [Bacillus carboniphilus]WLR44452.1 DUF3997 domain-containing protein [Bacillus carboniphilus]
MKNHLLTITILILLTSCAGVGDYEISLGGNFELVRANNKHVMVTYNSDLSPIIIPAKVVEINYNNDYIIAKQLGMKADEEDPDFEILDETDVNYWIVEKNAITAIGPLNEEDYKLKLEKLNIDLELKPAKSFR